MRRAASTELKEEKTMKKTVTLILTLLLCLSLVGCTATNKENTPPPDMEESQPPVAEPTPEVTEAPKAAETTYYVAGSFNGYSPNDPASVLVPVEGVEGVYSFAVSLTAELRDPTYDGHWYQITDGTWDNCWGTDYSAVQPAPVKYTGDGQAIGLGSLWIDADGDYTIVWDSVNKQLYDTSMVKEVSPRIYGDFNTALGKGADWGITDDDAILLAPTGTEGVYSAEVTMPAYAGEGEGYSMVVLTKVQFSAYLPWYGWGAVEQYLFTGEAAGMGIVSYLKPSAETTYVFTYDAATHITTVTEK